MPRYKLKNFTESDINNIISLYELGYDIQQIRDVTNIASSVIKKYLVMKFDNKIPITPNEKEYFRKAYKEGKSLTDISYETGRNVSVIRSYIKDLISIREKEEENKKIQNILKRKADKKSKDIIDIYLNSLYDISDIAKYYEIPDNYIQDVIKSWVDIHMPYNKVIEKPINTTKIKIFRDFYCNIGDKYEVIIHTYIDEDKLVIATIESIYPKIVMTDKGCFTYKDILLDSKLIFRNIKNN